MVEVVKLGSFPDFYCCYLLKSIPKPRSFYIGSTPDPIRRLRQHNGDLKAGGAYRTKRQGFRPWKMVAIVYGFPSKIAALQFEHAWQHSYQTRHIPPEMRITKSRSAGATLDHRIGNLKLLVSSNGFISMNLRVELFHPDAYHIWNKNRFNIALPDHIYVGTSVATDKETVTSIEDIGNYDQLKSCIERETQREHNFMTDSMKEWKNKVESSQDWPLCDICSSEISLEDLKGFCIHKGCDSITHMKCLVAKMEVFQSAPEAYQNAEISDVLDSQTQTQSSTWSSKLKPKSRLNKSRGNKLLKSTVSEKRIADPIIPLSGKCPKCEKTNVWISLVKNSRKINKELTNDN